MPIVGLIPINDMHLVGMLTWPAPLQAPLDIIAILNIGCCCRVADEFQQTICVYILFIGIRYVCIYCLLELDMYAVERLTWWRNTQS